MRAIASVFLFLAALIVGCSPDLDRLEGTLELEILNAPASADHIRAIVQNENGSVVVEVAKSATTSISIARTPEGLPVEVRVEALSGGAAVESQTKTTTLIAGITNLLRFDFDEPPVQNETEYSGQARLLIDGVTIADESGGTLSASVLASSDPSFAAFLDAARTTFGGVGPTAMEVDAGVHLELLASSVNAEKLRDLWGDEPFYVALTNHDGSVQIELGETSDRIELRTATFSFNAGSRASLAALQNDLVTGNFRVLIYGPSRIDPETTANLRVTISFTAFAPAT